MRSFRRIRGSVLKAGVKEPVSSHVSRFLSRLDCSHLSGAWVLSALLGSACGAPEDDRPPPPASSEADLRDTHLANYDPSTADERDLFAHGSCEDGATQSCRVYLPAHNGVQPCFVGTQTCVDSVWGSCGNAVLVDANAGDAEIAEE